MPTLYVRNEDNTDWYVLMIQGETALDDLIDVDTTNKADGDTLIWDNTAGQWVKGTPLKYSGLSKITVAADSPSNPTVGDLWINTA